MGRIYNLIGENLTITTVVRQLCSIATDDEELTAGGRIKIKRVEVSQSGTTTAAMCRLLLSVRDDAATLTGTSKTPINKDVGGPASVITGGTDGIAPMKSTVAATVDTNGTYVDLWAASFCNLNGWLWIPTPGEEIIIHNTSVFVVRFAADPALTGWTVGVTFEEL